MRGVLAGASRATTIWFRALSELRIILSIVTVNIEE